MEPTQPPLGHRGSRKLLFKENSLEQLYAGVIDVQHTFEASTVVSSDVLTCVSVRVKPSQLSE